MKAVKSKKMYSTQSFCDEFLGFCPMTDGRKDELAKLAEKAGYALERYPLDQIDKVSASGKSFVLVDTTYVKEKKGGFELATEYTWYEVPLRRRV